MNPHISSELYPAQLYPGVASCYGFAWQQMKRSFLELLLLIIISILLSIPTYALSAAEEASPPVALYLTLFGLAYIILVEWPLEYGIAFAFLKVARREKMKAQDIFKVYVNFTNAVLANLLVTFILICGFILLLVPGIYFACKLVFVPYLVVDQRMEAIEAIKKSWELTRGHAFTIFLMGVTAFFIAILGLIIFIVGIIPAIIWIRLAFASLYHAVINQQETVERPAI